MSASPTITKQTVKHVIDECDFVALVAMFDSNPNKVRRYIMRLTYDPDDAAHNAAIEAIRVLSHERSEAMPDFFLETLRRNMWAMNEEGANNAWSAPEIVGAVIAGNTGRYGIFFSYAYAAAIDELMFQPSLIKAFHMVEEVDPDLVAPFAPQILDLEWRLFD